MSSSSIHSIERQQLDTAADKLASLEKLDKTGAGYWNWFTVRTLFTSGAGFFTDSYDIFIINLVTPMLGYVYYSASGNKMPSTVEGVLKGMSSVGTFCGQLLFGFASDVFGRKIYGLELLIIIIGTINCATASSAVRGVSVIGFLCFWRFILGVGIGGDYPLSATITSEWSSASRRGMMMALIFSMQGIGNLAASIVTLIVLACFKNAVNADVMNLDYVWRLCIGLGVVPAVGTIWLRFTMPESPRYALNVQHDPEAAAAAKGQTASDELVQQMTRVEVGERSHFAEFYAYFKQWKNFKVLFGTASTWFLLDIAFYGLGLNNTIILSAIGFSSKPTPWETLWSNAVGQIIISALGSVPGYYLTVFTVEKMGRRTIQIMGFAMCTILFAILGGLYHQLLNSSMPGFIVIFTLAQLFQNWGANATTFIIPAEVFPTKVRSSAHGISAACGKAGAILASFTFNIVVEVGDTTAGQHAFLPQTLGIFAGIMALGLIITILCIPESKGKDLEEFEEIPNFNYETPVIDKV